MLSDKIDIPKYLNDYGIRPTAVRIIVFRAMYELHDTFRLTDLENTKVGITFETIAWYFKGIQGCSCFLYH